MRIEYILVSNQTQVAASGTSFSMLSEPLAPRLTRWSFDSAADAEAEARLVTVEDIRTHSIRVQ